MLRWFEKHNKISWVITVFGGIAIFYISSLSFGGKGGGALSIVYHVMAFFCFSAFLLISSLKGERKLHIILLAVSISVLYGILDELHQFFVPGRFASFRDVGWDSVGVLSASVIYLGILRYRSRKN